MNKQASKKWAKLVIAFVAILIIGGLFLYPLLARNPAKEVATPIENALIQNGAVKKCSRENNSRVPTAAEEPWYRGYYEMSSDRQKTMEIVTNAAKEKGFNLVTAAENPNSGITPEQIPNNWVFDYSKPSPFSNLEAGTVRLAVEFVNDGSKELANCDSQQNNVKLEGTPSKTIVQIHVGLPKKK